jgi:hypothetical protein
MPDHRRCLLAFICSGMTVAPIIGGGRSYAAYILIVAIWLASTEPMA